VLHRILAAGHAAPSVGLTQPWDFIRIESQATRHAFWEHVHDERRVFESTLDAAEDGRRVAPSATPSTSTAGAHPSPSERSDRHRRVGDGDVVDE
jgi:nitroreductase